MIPVFKNVGCAVQAPGRLPVVATVCRTDVLPAPDPLIQGAPGRIAEVNTVHPRTMALMKPELAASCDDQGAATAVL
jgi:hypothetical protein